MRCRKDEGFKVCSPLTRGEEEGIVPTCKKFHLCSWNWGNEEDRPEGLRARAFAYYVCVNPSAVDELRRHLFTLGVGDRAVVAAAGNVVIDLWEGDADKFLKGVGIQRELRDRYLDMITDSDSCPLPPGVTSDDEAIAKGMEDLIPVGLESGKALTRGGRPVTTSEYREELNLGASVVNHPTRRRTFPWRESPRAQEEAPRGEPASSSTRQSAPSRTPEESGEGRTGDVASDPDDNASNTELPSKSRSNSEGKSPRSMSPRSDGEYIVVKKKKDRRVRQA